jgi:hypothetical protein
VIFVTRSLQHLAYLFIVDDVSSAFSLAVQTQSGMGSACYRAQALPLQGMDRSSYNSDLSGNRNQDKCIDRSRHLHHTRGIPQFRTVLLWLKYTSYIVTLRYSRSSSHSRHILRTRHTRYDTVLSRGYAQCSWLESDTRPVMYSLRQAPRYCSVGAELPGA